MKNFYLVPIIDSSIFLNGLSLRAILANTIPELLQREEEIINILYSTSPLVDMPESEKIRYKIHNEETKKLFEKKFIPQYLIVVGDKFYTGEIVTLTKISAEYPSALGIRKTSEDEAKKYYINSNYKNSIANYFENCYLKYLEILKYDCGNKEHTKSEIENKEWQLLTNKFGRIKLLIKRPK